MIKGYIQSNSIIYVALVLKAMSRPLKSRANPIKPFLASSAWKIGVSACDSNLPTLSNAAEELNNKNN